MSSHESRASARTAGRPTPAASPWQPDVVALFDRLIAEGLPRREIASALNAAFGLRLSEDAVRRRRDRASAQGPLPPTRHQLAQEQRHGEAATRLVTEMWSQGLGMAEIAVALSRSLGQTVGRDWVSNRLRELGIYDRPQPARKAKPAKAKVVALPAPERAAARLQVAAERGNHSIRLAAAEVSLPPVAGKSYAYRGISLGDGNLRGVLVVDGVEQPARVR
jgi:transposase